MPKIRPFRPTLGEKFTTTNKWAVVTFKGVGKVKRKLFSWMPDDDDFTPYYSLECAENFYELYFVLFLVVAMETEKKCYDWSIL